MSQSYLQFLPGSHTVTTIVSLVGMWNELKTIWRTASIH